MPPLLTNVCSAVPLAFGTNVGHGSCAFWFEPVVMVDPGLISAVKWSVTSRPFVMSVLVTGTSTLVGILSLTASANIAWQKLVALLVSPQWPSWTPTRLNGYDGTVAEPV